MNWKFCRVLSVLAIVALSGSALAQQEEGALVEKVAVRNRLYSVDGRWEVGANVGLTLLTRLTEHYNFNASVSKNFADWLALELRGGYAYSRLTSLASQIQDDFAANTSISTINEMSDLWQMTANAMVGLRFQPIYGKLGLMAELPVHFQLYGWIGGGVGLFTKESLQICTQKSGTRACDQYFVETAPGPLLSAALGFRFFLGNNHSVKIEVRDYAYLDSYYVEVRRDQVTAASPTAGGRLSPNASVTNLVQLDLGYSYLF